MRGACVNIQIVIPTPGTPDEYLEPKDPSEDVGANDAVADWKKDDTGGNAANGHTVSNADGSTVSNGYQADPTADAATAANNTAETNQELTDEHNAATDTATPVNTTQDKTVTTNPGW